MLQDRYWLPPYDLMDVLTGPELAMFRNPRVASSLLLPAALLAWPTDAGETGKSAFAGRWLMEGKAGLHCAIFRHGASLVVINEKGQLATARAKGTTLTVAKGDAWPLGLNAELRDGGRTLAWRNGTSWKHLGPPLDEDDRGGFAGKWIIDGKGKTKSKSKVCDIYRHNGLLVVVNEKGEPATARATGRKLVILKGDDWPSGLAAELRDSGRILAWENGTFWHRP